MNMTMDEAKEIVEKMYADSAKDAPPQNHPGHSPYILGSWKVKMAWVIFMSKLKVTDFNEKGNVKMPGER